MKLRIMRCLLEKGNDAQNWRCAYSSSDIQVSKFAFITQTQQTVHKSVILINISFDDKTMQNKATPNRPDLKKYFALSF